MNENSESNQFLITDELIQAERTNLTASNKKFKQSIFHKYFITSVFQVHDHQSRLFLLDNLLRQLFNSIYHFPISDCDNLFIILFDELASNEDYISSSELQTKIFKAMNYFIKSFYKFGFSFIYRPTIESSIFNRDIAFNIQYFIVFSDLIHSEPSQSFVHYFEILIEDGSIDNILHYFYDLYSNGIEFKNVKLILQNLFNSSLITNNLFDFMKIRNLFNGCGFIVNEEKKIVLRLPFIFESFPNLLNFKYDTVSESQEEISAKRESILNDIRELKMIEFVNSYFHNYVQELIVNKAYADPSFEMIDFNDCHFISDKENIKESDCLFQTLVSLYAFFDKHHVNDLILNFSDICISLIPFVRFLSSPMRSLIIHIFRLSDEEQFDSNRIKMIEMGNSLLLREFESPKQMKNMLYSFFILFFHQEKKEYLICEPIDFFNLIPDDNLESHLKILSVLYDSVKNLSSERQIVYIIHILEKYSSLLDDPNFLTSLFQFLILLNKSDIKKIPEELIGNIHHLFEIIFTLPDLPEQISENDVFHFCSIYSDVLIDFPHLDELKNDSIQNYNSIKIQALSLIYLKDNERYKLFSQQIFESIVQAVNSEKDDVSIEQVILTSPFLITTKFTDNPLYQNVAHQWLDQLFDTQPNSIQSLPNKDNSEEFSIDTIDQTIINIVYSLINSYGFDEIETILRILDLMLQKYGMCIEILNILSRVIEFLIPFEIIESDLSRIDQLNAFLAPVLLPLIVNTNNSFHMEIENDLNYPQIIFSLRPLLNSNYKNDSLFNCFYSYRFKGEALSEPDFSFRIKKSNKPFFLKSFIKVCSTFVSNMAKYGINIINRFHVLDQFYNDCLEFFIMYAISNALLKEQEVSLLLPAILNFASDKDISFEKIEQWIGALTKCVNSLEFRKNNTAKKDLEYSKRFLTNIYTFFVQINGILPGIINQNVAKEIFEDDEERQSLFLEMMDADQDDIKSFIDKLFVKEIL